MFFTSYRGYVKNVKEASETGESRREPLKPKQFIPIQIKHVFSRRHADGAPLVSDQLLVAARRHAGSIRGGKVLSDQLSDGVRRA